MSDLVITASDAGTGTTVVSVDGSVTYVNAHRLARELHAALDSGAARLVVDLSSVGFMDSSGLAALLRAATTAHRMDGALTLVHDPSGPPSILRFKGVEQLIRMFPDREQALASAGASAEA